MDDIKSKGMLCCITCIVFIAVTIGGFSSKYGYKKTFKYIHKNIFDEHMVINILMNIGLIAALLGIFFFSYAATVEENIVKANAKIAVSDIMESVSPLLNYSTRKKFKER